MMIARFSLFLILLLSPIALFSAPKDQPSDPRAAAMPNIADYSKLTAVEVNGFGGTKEEALMDAFYNAIQNVVGVYVSSSTELINGELIKDRMAAMSEGLISEYDVVSPFDGEKVRVKAYVDRSNVNKNLFGKNEDESILEALKLYIQAAKNGNTEAQLALSDMYYKGEGVKQDYEEAAKWYKLAHKVDAYDRGVEYIEIAIGSYPKDDIDRYSITLLIKNNEEMGIFGNFRQCALSEMYGARPSGRDNYYKLTTKQQMDLADKQLIKYQLAECKSGRCTIDFSKLYKNPYLSEFTKIDIAQIADNYKEYTGLELFYEFFYEKLNITYQTLHSGDEEVSILERADSITRILNVYEDVCGHYVMKREIFDANKKIIKRELLTKLGISQDIIQQMDSLGIVE